MESIAMLSMMGLELGLSRLMAGAPSTATFSPLKNQHVCHAIGTTNRWRQC